MAHRTKEAFMEDVMLKEGFDMQKTGDESHRENIWRRKNMTECKYELQCCSE